MTEVNLSDPVAAAALMQGYLDSLPKDVAEGFMKKLADEAKAQEVKRYTATVLSQVTEVLKDVGAKLMEAIPAGREIRIFHRAALPAKDGQPAVEAALHFAIETSSSQTSTGKATPRETGKLIRCTLDGQNIEATTWRGALDKVNEALPEGDRCKIPNGAFSANRELNAFAVKLNKKAGKARLEVHGDVNEKPEPAPAPAPEGTTPPEGTPETK